ncbi:MAG: ABC transporter substrate-binding protein, partial [Acidobacteria bacterium]
MRTVLECLLVVALSLWFASCGGEGDGPRQTAQPLVAIAQFVEHPVLDQVRNGFKDHFAKKARSISYREFNAQGDFATASMIAQQVDALRPDLVLAIATPSAQACRREIKDRPLVFGAITDPVAAGLVRSLEQPGVNATGTSDFTPIVEQLDLILEIQPGCKTIGTIHNSSEINSTVLVRALEEACKRRGIVLKVTAVTNSSEVLQAAMNLAAQVDALYEVPDNTVATAFASLVKACRDRKVPLYGGEAEAVEQGAVASLAIDYYQLGLQTGAIAERI